MKEAFEIIPRPVPPTIAHYLSEQSLFDFPTIEWEGLDLRTLKEHLLATLPQLKGEGLEHLTDDIIELCKIGLENYPYSYIKLLLRPLRTDGCRFYHTDLNHQRLLCSYVGPGTEVVPEHNVNRAALGTGNNARVILDFSRVKRLKAGDVVILKGDRHPDCKGQGAVHRSPEIEASHLARLVLRVDFLSLN